MRSPRRLNIAIYTYKCKKNFQLKQSVTVTRPTPQLEEKNVITLAAGRHNVNVLLSNSTFLIFPGLVVRCRPCRSYRLF